MFTERVFNKRRVGWFIGLLGIIALACNAPIGGETPSPPPPATSAETTQPTPTTAESPTAEINSTIETEGVPTGLPTFTPIQATAPAGATATTPATPTEISPSTPQPTPTEKADGGPLSFSYTITWQVSSNPGFAIATVSIVATGGGGGYQYFRDDLPVSGPVFQYQWATCRANPGSLRVDSADGQSVRENYFETPPCPATPTS
jgi:hypothetical protein